jgi:hypothetical protein
MARYHYLSCSQLIGESVAYAAFSRGEVVALLGWAAAALRNTERDAYVGWDRTTKARRLRLVVNNVRFLVLPWAQEPNLASRVLGANLRRLSADWEARFQHPVYLAETFVDSSRFRGTCYRASNWIELGQTSGWSKHGPTYRHHGNPKTVFVYPLVRRAREVLSTPERAVERPGKESPLIDVAKLPLAGQGGLFDALKNVVDFRKRRGVRHPLVSVLAVAVCAVLSGMRSFDAMGEWVADLPRDLRERLGCVRRQPPSESTIRRVVSNVNPTDVEKHVGAWAVQNVDLKNARISLDGKTLCGSADGDNAAVHLLSAILQGAGVVLTQMRVSEKTNEIPCVEPLLSPLDIRGAVVSGDAMHTQKATATNLVERKKADYVFTVKENQPTLRKDIEDLGLGAFPPSGRNDR